MGRNIKFIVLFFFTIVLTCSLYENFRNKSEKNSDLNVQLISVYDGDSFYVNVHGWPDIIGKKISIRINGIDAPEMNISSQKTKAIESRNFLKSILENAEKIDLKNIKRDKYFRIGANVEVDGIDVGKLMIEKNLAKPYYGGKKLK